MHGGTKALWALLVLSTSAARAELQVEGVSDEVARNVQNFVALAGEPCDAEPWLLRRRFRTVEAEVREALEKLLLYRGDELQAAIRCAEQSARLVVALEREGEQGLAILG